MKTNTLKMVLVLLVLIQCSIFSQSAEELAKKLANPIASLISVPLQNNIDFGIGNVQATRYTLNIQPVVPIRLNDNLNLITRYIVPVITQYNITGTGSSQFGLSDATVSALFSPVESKITWGVGPVFLVPIGTDAYLTTKKFGIGPTAVALMQSDGWTYGALINQIWSVAGSNEKPNVNQLFFQPFLVYNWKSGAGLGVNMELTQNWEGSTTVAWLNPILSAVTSLDNQKVQLVVGPRINIAAPDGSKADLGIRAVIVFLLPN